MNKIRFTSKRFRKIHCVGHTLASMAGVRKGRGRELGCETYTGSLGPGSAVEGKSGGFLVLRTPMT